MAKTRRKPKTTARKPRARRAGIARRLLTRLGRGLAVLALVGALLSVLMVLALRWLDPPISSFMLQHLAGQWLDGRGSVQLYHRWVPMQSIAASAALAVVAAEDQRFPRHHGFDLKEIANALRDYWRGGRLRGASTLTQQLAKNLFLWSGRDPLRKGLEIWFTGLLELCLSKQRILELYLNVAQFGPNTFGLGMAAERYFGKPAADLSIRESSLLAALLPSPRRYRLNPPSPYVTQRAGWIRGQMRNLGKGHLR